MMNYLKVSDPRETVTERLARFTLVNGISSHALDFDDTHPGSIAHVSAVVAPAALAAAEAAAADGRRLAMALLVGNEITGDLGAAWETSQIAFKPYPACHFVHAPLDQAEYETREYDTFPESLPGGVRVALTGGTELERHLPHQRGGEHNPLGADDVRLKFRANASLALSDEDARAVEDGCLSLRSRPDMSVFAALARATSGSRA